MAESAERPNTEPAWPIPRSYRDAAADEPGSAEWLPALRSTAIDCAERWGLVPDGPALHGWTSMVWPVRDHDGRRLMLKVSPPMPYVSDEAAALHAFAATARPTGPHMITPVQADPALRAVLLPRLDASRSLQDHPDIDEAVEVIAALLGQIASVPALPGLTPLGAELDQMAERISLPGPLPVGITDRARARIRELRTILPTLPQRTLHGDLHFLNVLHTESGDPPCWIGIDPLPLSGITAWEAVPMLRNRWADALANGDPDRALRRRVDQVCAATGDDAELVRACAQIASVSTLFALLPARPDHLHAPAYRVMADW